MKLAQLSWTCHDCCAQHPAAEHRRTDGLIVALRRDGELYDVALHTERGLFRRLGLMDAPAAEEVLRS